MVAHIYLVVIFSVYIMRASVADEGVGIKNMASKAETQDLYKTPHSPEHIDITVVAVPSDDELDIELMDTKLLAVNTGEPLVMDYPPPPVTSEPVITRWVNPLFGKTGSERKGRHIKTYTRKGNSTKYSSAEEMEQKRAKRSVGDGIPSEFLFMMEALPPYDTEDAEFKIGSIVSYKCTIYASVRRQQASIEIFSELEGGTFFTISNVRFGHVGGNLDTFTTFDKEILYNSVENTGRYDYATINLGRIVNSAANVDDETESMIEILFDAQARVNPLLTDGMPYRISVGALFDDETVIIAQDDLSFDSTVDTTVDTSFYDEFEITGPDTLSVGTTGVWTVTATLHDLYCEFSLDVLTPVNLPGVMTVDSISIAATGENYWHGLNVDMYNHTSEQYENFGDYARLDLGTIINAGYHDYDYDPKRNTITFEVAVTMLNHMLNTTDPYNIGFTMWKRGVNVVEIVWSGIQTVRAEENQLPDLPHPPFCFVTPSADTVVVGGTFGILVNLTLPANSTSNYVIEIETPVLSNVSVIDLGRVRVSKIGFNVPHLYRSLDLVNVNNQSTGVLEVDLGVLSDTGQRSGIFDDNVQIEIAATLRDVITDHYSIGDSVTSTIIVWHAGDCMVWSGTANVTLGDNIQTYEQDQVPMFTLYNVMGSDAKIYPETAAVLDMDIVIPPGVNYRPFMIEFDSLNETDALVTDLKIVGSEIVHSGSALIYHIENTTYINKNNETERNGDLIYNKVTWTFNHVTNLQDRHSKRDWFGESTIRLRVFVIARGEAEDRLINNATQWISGTVIVADDYIYATRLGIRYSNQDIDFYTGYDWQPGINLALADGYHTSEIGWGSIIRYNIAINIPYRTFANIKVTAEADNSSPIMVCHLILGDRGDALVDYLPPTHAGFTQTFDQTTYKLVTAYEDISAITSYSYDYYQGDVFDSYINYTVVAILTDRATIGQSYNFSIQVDYGLMPPVLWTPELTTTDDPPTETFEPEFNITHKMETYTINVGGSEIFYVDIFVPPGSAYKYDVRVYAPWNDTYAGEYEILHAFVVSHGENLTAYHGLGTEVFGNSSSLASFDIGYVANTAVQSEFMPSEENRIRMAVHVGLLANTSLSVGDMFPIAVSVNMNNGLQRWIGRRDFEVIPPEDQRNVVPMTNLSLTISAHSDMIYSVGETQNYTGEIWMPPGMAVTEFMVIIESPLVGEETLMTIDNKPNLTFGGNNMLEAFKYQNYTFMENPFWQTYSQIVDFGFVRNLDFAAESDLFNETADDNVVRFDFSLRLMDHVTLLDNHQFEFTAKIVYSSENGTVVNATGDITITVYAPSSDTTVLDWNVYFLETPPESVVQDDVLSFGLDIGVDSSTKRFPDNLTLYYRVPFFSTVVPQSMSFSGLESAFTATPEVNQYGLQFDWNRIRYDNEAQVNFSIVVDPDKYLEFGLLTRHVDIPIDIGYFEEQKNSPGTFDELYTHLFVLSFNITIPEVLDALGLADGSIIDCQISASIDDGVNTAQDGRLNSDSGWATLERGPPFYQHEYIQVDFGGEVRMTGITIQPFNDFEVSRITTFKLQHSREGILWNYFMDSGSEKVFNVTWSDSVTVDSTVLITFDSEAFTTRFIRLVPQENAENSYSHKLRFELHGWPWPYKSQLPTYVCPPDPEPVKPYYERQFLGINDTAYVCVIARPNDLPYCSGSNDFGVSWFAIDDNVMNILGYEEVGNAYYALARNRLGTLRSTDKGHTWFTVMEEDFTAMSSLSTYTEAKALPFPLTGSAAADLLAAYGFTDDGVHSWSVSNQALHAYPTDLAGVANKTLADNKVAQWGSTEWN